MQDCLLPTAVGFDLDGLYGNGDRGSPDAVIKKRLAEVRKVLASVAGPQFICLGSLPDAEILHSCKDRGQGAEIGSRPD